jgi:hypothetical protein
MVAAFELAATDLEANVFGLVVGVGDLLLFSSLGRLLFSGAAVLAALVTPAVELGSAEAEAQGMLNLALVAHGLC